MPNIIIAAALGLKITMVRMKCYELGLYNLVLEFWTPAQVHYLVKHYQTKGDKELAEMFNKKWMKKKGWSFKHIEKKRKYMSLKRTPEQLKAIHQRNVDQGRFLLCPVKRWLVTGVAKEGEIRMWRSDNGRMTPRIKVKGKFIHWARWAWKSTHGRIPKGKVVVFKDDNPYNISIDNLETITRADNSRRNSIKSSQGLSDNYVAYTLSYKDPEMRALVKNNPGLLELKRQQLLLNRTIKKHSDGKS